jgi:transcription antitermination factor NusG
MAGWAVIRTHSNLAKTVERNLGRQGFDFYNPKILRKNSTIVQLFMGYMFVQARDRWHALRTTFGVFGVLMSNKDVPARVSDEVIKSLRAKEANGIVMLNKSRFALGQQVQIKSGPMAYEVGLFDGQRDRDRVYILLNMLGCECRATVYEDNLDAA